MGSPRESGEAALEAFQEAGGDPSPPGVQALILALGRHATALLPLALRDPTLPRDVLARPLARRDDLASFRRTFRAATAGLSDGPELLTTLRRLRHRAVVRIAAREILRHADIDQTSAEMAWLASAAIEAALDRCTAAVTATWGTPVDASGAPIPMVVLGMGKLGGDELNIGSDVDLCFFYETDDATVEGSEKTAHQIFARIASQTAKALSQVTEDGFAFRVDLRLRPEGSRGPLVNSLASAERYYETFGRTWERGALLRARPVAGDPAFGNRLLDMLRPFVFRRAVDPSLADAMAEMLRRSRVELHVDAERDIKLGRGGIREAEFCVQALQLIWGGRHLELQVPGTVEAIRRLVSAGFLTDREGAALEADWALLRRVEHRIHVQAGYQTHSLPPAGEALDRFGRSLGFADSAALVRELAFARHRVATLFDSLCTGVEQANPELETLSDLVATGAPAAELGEAAVRLLPLHDADEAGAHLSRLGRRAEAPLGPVTRERLPELGPLLLREIGEAADPDEALARLADFFARLAGPWGYDRLLRDEPRITRRLIGLFGASATLSAALCAYPEWLFDLLGSSPALHPDGIRAMHAQAPFDWDGERPEPEVFVAALRRAKMLCTLQIGLARVGEDIDPVGAERALSALADAQVGLALRYAREETEARTGRPSQPGDGEAEGMVVVGLGKLGAREMGFGSDLDLVFLYGADGTAQPGPGGGAGEPVTHAELFTRVAQRTIRLLSQPDASGPGYDTDTRLRPSGSQGMLVVSLRALDRYHAERAAAWERQAWVRARPIAGDLPLARLVEGRRIHIAFGGDAPAPAEVAALRARMERELSGERPDRYNPKVGYGGLVDVEFVVQCLQMGHGDDASVRSPTTLEALAALRAAGHLTPPDADALGEGYRFARSVEQALRLMDERREATVVPGGRVWARVARRLGLRDRDGQRAAEVLGRTWRRHAGEVRAVFERLLAPVGVEPPWGET